ncbi:Phosphomevalonate kinase [Phlyctema vagabunda]|uniref:Phosphomevalonate kinase n=1 Tax=Phlyctema vagabunda TaxID=108571 RepID=A0ABR4P549_9HELO
MVTAISAPGKVFLAGGYLVLDRAYHALVFGLSARIHVLVQEIDTSSGVQLSEIVVESPQFRDATWNYGFHLADEQGGVEVTQLQGSTPASRNPFVETALAYALTYISSISSQRVTPTKVTILADNDYYSQSASSATSEKSTGSKHFSDFGVRLADAHKTGLGSSAALVTAFTGAVLSYYLPQSQFSLESADGRRKLHNIAQAAHCAAQGKVGSGFDVAAAVYGSCVYRRFSPSVLASTGEPGSAGFSVRVKQLVEDTAKDAALKWDYEIDPDKATIPEGTALIMCDVDCGSQTVSMVKKVQAWQKQDPAGSRALSDELHKRNKALAAILESGDLDAAPGAFAATREKIREMGQRSDVPIEPQEQTALLDAITQEVDGVYGGVVPGAGGYDAIVLLVKKNEKTLNAVKEFLASWIQKTESNVKLLDTTGEMEGARIEDGQSYGTWTEYA